MMGWPLKVHGCGLLLPMQGIEIHLDYRKIMITTAVQVRRGAPILYIDTTEYIYTLCVDALSK